MRNFRLATVNDMERLQEMVRQSRMKVGRVPSMTFVAEEDGTVQAALGLDFETEAVIAGPLVVAPEAKGKVWMILRLVETMERWLTAHGGNTYIFGVAMANKRWNRIIEKLGATRYIKKDGRNWYQREVRAA